MNAGAAVHEVKVHLQNSQQKLNPETKIKNVCNNIVLFYCTDGLVVANTTVPSHRGKSV